MPRAPLCICQAQVLVIITGTHKAYALAKCIEEGVNHMFTVRRPAAAPPRRRAGVRACRRLAEPSRPRRLLPIALLPSPRQVSSIQMHPKAVIVCDEDATLELRVRTAKYFKSLPHREEMLGLPTPSANGEGPAAKRQKQ